MTPERWRQITGVFHAALARDAATRAPFLNEACASDPDLRAEVDALLKAHHEAGPFGQEPIRALPPPGAVPLAPGTTLGPYQIQALLGAGGMGEVYKAIDARLERTVAIKVLLEHVASDSELRQRFEREAKTVASLSHPHICPLFDVGEQDGVHFLVMEYLDGETLARRLENGPLPLAQALRYATEIADALDKAHRRGIVHRDLKPGNIMLTAAGAKLLDFGLAKLHKPGAIGVEGFSTATTASVPLTGRGSLLGTLPYMAPEQLQGRDTDGRTDIFAFGAVLYEMLTGERAFEAPSQASLIGAILKDNVPLPSARQPMTPRALDRAIQRCLAKDPDDRWQSAGDLRHELQWIATDPLREAASVPGQAARPRSRERLWWAAVVLVGIVGTWIAVATLPNPEPIAPGQVIRLQVSLPSGLRLPSTGSALPMTVSPNGERVVFSAVDANDNVQLYVRELNALEVRAIPETEGGFAPFFSPDGASIGFAASGALKKVSLTAGPAVTIAAKVLDEQFGGASWGADDTIVFASSRIAGLSRVPASGGIPTALTAPVADTGEVSHFLPQFLPGGRAVLFTMRAGLKAGPSQVEVLSLDTGKRHVVAESGINARYAATGHVVFAGTGLLAGSLWAVPFDTTTLNVTGPAVRVLDSLLAAGGLSYFTLADRSGTLIYLPQGESAPEELVWIGTAGQTSTLVDTPGNFRFPRLSPDGKRLAVTIAKPGDLRSGIWLLDLDRPKSPVLFTSQGGDHLPVWTPDGTRLVFSSLGDGSNREGPANLYWKRLDDTGDSERLTQSAQHQDPGSWSPDATLLMFAESHPTTRWDVWVLDMKDRKPRPLLRTLALERQPMVSPDGRWFAYASDESGREEVYVQAFPGGGQKQLISNGGGNEPLWARDGHRLFYRRDKAVIAVAVSSGARLVVGSLDVVVEGVYAGRAGNGAPNYEVSADGRRFLMVRRNDVASLVPTELDVVLNWFVELATRVRTK